MSKRMQSVRWFGMIRLSPVACVLVLSHVFCILPGVAFAQTPPPPQPVAMPSPQARRPPVVSVPYPPPPGTPNNAADYMYARGESTRNVGIFLVTLGSICFVGSVVLFNLAISRSHDESGSYYSSARNDADLYALNGMLALLGAGAGLGIGIPFWIRGSREIDQAILMRSRYSLRPYVLRRRVGDRWTGAGIVLKKTGERGPPGELI